ncbi:hypothetical protein Misp01_45730 [Microtetraspora sp. NBRC 13810]|nr:hypothetical protein Misp01_45730 [Microtetraspora sp. NBRC 13810]
MVAELVAVAPPLPAAVFAAPVFAVGDAAVPTLTAPSATARIPPAAKVMNGPTLAMMFLPQVGMCAGYEGAADRPMGSAY